MYEKLSKRKPMIVISTATLTSGSSFYMRISVVLSTTPIMPPCATA